MSESTAMVASRTNGTAVVRAAFDSLVCHIAVLAPTGNVVCVNEAWKKSAATDGVSAVRSEVGTNYLTTVEQSALSCADAQHAIEGIRAVLASGAEQFSFEYPAQIESEQRWFQMMVTPCDVQGSVHAVVTHRPIDDHKRAEEELRQLHRSKDEFFATLLHELRNPLAPIASALELLGVRADDPRIVTSARGIIQRQLRQLTRLVDDLLDVSRIARGTVELKRDTLDIARVIGSATETARPLIELRRHHLSTTLPVAALLVEADPLRLGQVFTNLLINAAKYTEPGGHISVIVERAEDAALVRVRDDGIGISKELLPRIFDLFTQAAPRSKGSMGGLGVGLALARQLIELHGGSIAVRSEGAGRGSEFTVRLPLPAVATMEHLPVPREWLTVPARSGEVNANGVIHPHDIG